MYHHSHTAPLALLQVIKGPEEGRVFEVSQAGVTLGRNSHCGICLDHASVSRCHARIFEEEGGFFIEDLNSRNGVIVNGRRGKRIRLQNDDLIKICGYQFRFELAAPHETAKSHLVEETSAP